MKGRGGGESDHPPAGEGGGWGPPPPITTLHFSDRTLGLEGLDRMDPIKTPGENKNGQLVFMWGD